MVNYETLTLSLNDGLAVLTLNRPDKLNALNGQLRKELVHAIRHVGAKDTSARGLLIMGKGKAFCSGADLYESMEQGSDWDAGANLMETYHPILLELAALNIPVIAAVNGVAAGAGMSIAIAADIVIAAESAYFLQAFINIGLVPDAGSTYILPRLIGEARAKSMMMLGEKISATKAQNWGMIHSVVPDEELSESALSIAKKFATGPTVALSGIRKLLAVSSTNSFSAQIQAEALAQRTASQSFDCVEGVTAFIQKRTSNFSGR